MLSARPAYGAPMFISMLPLLGRYTTLRLFDIVSLMSRAACRRGLMHEEHDHAIIHGPCNHPNKQMPATCTGRCCALACRMLSEQAIVASRGIAGDTPLYGLGAEAVFSQPLPCKCDWLQDQPDSDSWERAAMLAAFFTLLTHWHILLQWTACMEDPPDASCCWPMHAPCPPCHLPTNTHG